MPVGGAVVSAPRKVLLKANKTGQPPRSIDPIFIGPKGTTSVVISTMPLPQNWHCTVISPVHANMIVKDLVESAWIWPHQYTTSWCTYLVQ